VHGQGQAGFFHDRAEHTGQIRRESSHIDGLVGGLHATGFEAGKIQQRIDQPQQPQAVAVDHRHLVLVGRGQLFGMPQHLLQRPQHQGKRGPKLVADIAEKSGFCSVQLGESFGTLAFLLIGLGVGNGGSHLGRHQV
jgi:hypothetical protein